MSLRNHWAPCGLAALMLLAPVAHAVEGTEERQSIEEVRNTVINLLKALVEKGLLTREQAELMVKQAQDKAAADQAAAVARNAQQAKEEQNAVRVPYVPQIVKDEISRQVAAEVKPAVVADVVKEAKDEKWGVPAALPEWLSRVKMFGDVTLREQNDWYPRDNSQNLLLDYNAINQAGGYARAQYPFLNTTQDRNRLRLRARLGAEADINPYLTAYVRLASGSLVDPGSESQTLGQYGQRYTVGFDQAYLQWNTNTRDNLSVSTLQGGRLPNPWFAPTELVFARDLSFEGVAETLRFGWGDGKSDRSHVYATVGAFPMLEVPLVNQENKWLVGGQIGTNLRFNGGADHIRFAGAYYDFLHVTGRMNDVDSTLLNYTAPAFLRQGNSVYDISNVRDIDPTVNLFALAAHFRLVDIAANYEHTFPGYSLAVTGEGVRNIGYNQSDVEALTHQKVTSPQNKGYVGEVSFGRPVVDRFAAWRVAVGYRYVKADAVLDAWTDADFHEGGTNTQGYYFWTTFGVAKNTWLRLRYMSGNEIDGSARYGDDILQLDVNARF